MNGLVHDHKAPFIIGLAGKNYCIFQQNSASTYDQEEQRLARPP